VSVVFVGNRASAAMNRKFLGHAGGTDVISFPLGEGRRIEGEIYVNLDRAKAQAREYGVPFGEEVARLVVHGTLHLFGYDDRTAPKARRMKAREDRYVGLLSS
jgi:probable rRNA maturation factor